MWRNFWLSLSFANLVYLRAWTDFIPVRSSDLFIRKALPGISLYFAVTGDVLDAATALDWGLVDAVTGSDGGSPPGSGTDPV